jgi:hypothetical protein
MFDYYNRPEPMRLCMLFYIEVPAEHPRAGLWMKLPEAAHLSWLYYGSRAEFMQEVESGQSPAPAGHIPMIPAPHETTHTGSEPA